MFSALAKANVKIKAIARARASGRVPAGGTALKVAGRCCGVLGHRHHPLVAESSFLLPVQGSSEYNITVLVDQADSERALRAVHR